jgi:exodeoxyribonuclease VII small subunit
VPSQDPRIDLTFEEAFAELQGTVERLRGDALTLEGSLALYERGTSLAAHCNDLLTSAELRVTQLHPDIDHQAVEGRFEPDW